MRRRSVLFSSGLAISALTGCVLAGNDGANRGNSSTRTRTQTPPSLSSDNEAYQGGFTTGGAWATHCFNAGRSGYNSNTGSPNGQVGVAWLRTPIKNHRTFRTTPPVTDDSHVYVGSGTSENSDLDLQGGLVAAFDGETGQREWRTATDSETVEGIVHVDGMLLARCESYDPASAELVALATTDGSEQWRTAVPLGQLGGSVVLDGRAYVTAVQGGLTAVSLDGTRQWERSVGVSEDEHASTAPCATESSVFVGTDQGRVIAFDTESGQQQWYSEVVEMGHRPRIQTIPTVADDTVFVTGTDYRAHAITTADGTERWSTRLLKRDYGNALPSVTVVADSVYSNTMNGGLIALRQSDGTERWRSGGSGWDGPPGATDNRIIAPIGNGVRAYDLDGQRHWSFEASRFDAGMAAYIMNPQVALAHDQAYMSLNDGRLFALGAK